MLGASAALVGTGRAWYKPLRHFAYSMAGLDADCGCGQAYVFPAKEGRPRMAGTDTAASSTAPVQGLDLFLRNMAALWQADPPLAQQIDDLSDSILSDLQPTKAGPPTLSVQLPAGRTVWVHSKYDPTKQAEQMAQAIDEKKVTIVLTGLGLGYPVEAIWKRMQGRCLIIVFEPDLAMLFRALHCADLSAAIGADRLVFLTREDTDLLHSHLERHNLLLMAGTQIVSFAPGLQLAEEFHKRMSQRLTDFVAYCNMSVKTIFANAVTTCRNVAYNLPTYVATPPIDHLKGRFAGYPGILVAAGPSLRKHLDMLAGLQDRAAICCVQTVFKTLLAKGITPHFVTSLDYSEISKRFFEGVQDFRGVHLVAEPKAASHVVDAYGGPVSLLDNSFARMCLGDDLAGRSGLRAGATVAHLCFYLLEYLGCDPIIMIGQDLAFSDGLYYAPGVAVHEIWQAELNRYNTLEMMEWLRVARNRNILHPATDIAGNAVYTDEQMLTYLQQFERDIAACAAKVIDATEGGLPKRGAQRMGLAQAAQQYCQRPFPARVLAYRQELRWWDASRLGQARQRILDRLERLEQFENLCRQTGEDLRQLQKLVDRPAEFNRGIARADRARILVQKDKLILRMVSDVAQLAEYRRLTADRLLEGQTGLPPTERARKQLQRDEEYNQGLIESCGLLRGILEEVVRRFDAAMDRQIQGGRS